MDQPAWLAAAWAEFGVQETPGTATTGAIAGYFREAGHGEITDDATPWCAAFAAAMLKRGGVTGTTSLLARSYLAWGDGLSEPRPGAIAVLSRGEDEGAGHVGFYLGGGNGQVVLLGGNQGDGVAVTVFKAAAVLGFRWPHGLATAAPVEPGLFERALAHVLEMEGGYSDDPYDPGGPTNKGITLSEFAKWRHLTVTALTRMSAVAALKGISDDEVRDIYRAKYWQPASCALLPEPVAVMHFDAAVNHGTGGATRLLQAALGVTADGEIGPETLQMARQQPVPVIVQRYAELRRARYRALPHFWRFGRGWLRRVAATETLALSLAGDVPAQPETAKGTTNMGQDFKFPLPGDVPGMDVTMPGGKWWPQSKTVWGALLTAVTTVLPVVGPLIGINISADMIKVLGDQAVVVVQAAGGLIGTLLTLYGRAHATGPLVRQNVNLKM